MCISERRSLSEELRKNGLTYDHLIYRHNPPYLTDGTPYEPWDREEPIAQGIPAVSFFSGGGGLDLGFSMAGFKVLAAFERDVNACLTLRTNFKDLVVVGPPDADGDLRNRDETISVLKSLGIGAPFEGVFLGGPPCQPFSIASNQRFSKDGPNFKRIGFSHAEYGSLLDDFIFYINIFQPRAFLIENVPGMSDGKEYFCALGNLEVAGYNFKELMVNASNYGVPQERRRLLIVGWRTDSLFRGIKEELGVRHVLSVLQQPLAGIANHVTREHEAESVLRYMELQYGQRDKLGRVDRLHPGLPSKTIISGGSKGGGRSHLHPTIPRTLSPRECARIQTFPDTYVFQGAVARQFTQIGNAVPPRLAFVVARSILNSLFL